MKYINKSFLVLSMAILASSAECSQKGSNPQQKPSQLEKHVMRERIQPIPFQGHKAILEANDLRDVRDRPTPPGAFPANFPYAGSAQQAEDIIRMNNCRYGLLVPAGYYTGPVGLAQYTGPVGIAQQHEKLESRERLLDAHDDQLNRVNQGNANHHQRLDVHDQKIAQLTRQFAALQSTVMVHTERLDLHAGLRRADHGTCIEHETRLETLEKQHEQLQGQVKEIAAEQAQIRICRIANKQDNYAHAAAGK